MTDTLERVQSRRALIRSALVLAGGAAVTACTSRGSLPIASASSAPPLAVPPAPVPAPVVASAKPALITPKGVRPELFNRAVAALDKHSMRIESHDRMAIADFTVSSNEPRFFFVNLGTGEVESMRVAHGSGSDPEHTGLLHRFSNDPGSNATSEGAFVTSDYYFGKHGASQRLAGLDPTNDNAMDRAIVIHCAKYANPEHIATWGKLGRSQGCFAVGEADLERVFLRLGPGRLLYSDRV